ncbi:MAG: MATE family efflux transporter [Oscillospiraceae bacterium]|nr:MATE family efflux transporter [Oscillospiraceae bacterium]
MHIHLSERFSYGKLLRFTLPSVIMMIFTSLYGVADGFFVSNFAGKNPFTAVNFIMPFLMILGAMGFMFGTGGSALIAKTMGEGDSDMADRQFSLLVYTTLICGVIIAALGIIFIHPVASVMGAEGELLENCVLYGRIILLALPFYMLQFEFQSFFSTAEKPRLGLAVTIAAGMANIIGDALLVAVFRFGIVGAAAATALSQAVGGIIPLFYFALPNTSRLKLTKTRLDLGVLAKVCTNGSSELMSNISMSLVNMLYNVQLMKYAGEDGVAAYGTLMYVNLVFLAAFIGYSVGTAPIVSFHYGAEDYAELKSLLKKSCVIISVFAVIMFADAELLARPLAKIFTGYDEGLLSLTVRGFFIFSFTFLFAGFAIFGSAFFTALNDGLTSALISFLRTLVFQTAAVLVLPLIWGIDGVWVSSVAAEFTAAAITVIFIFAKRKKYRYL